MTTTTSPLPLGTNARGVYQQRISTSPAKQNADMYTNGDIVMNRGDCITLMDSVPDKSVDMIFSDLPYAATHNAWDKMLPLDALWRQYARIIKDNGCICLWGQPPFTFRLASAATVPFRYEWVIEKTSATGWLNAKRMPLKAHESILVFYRKLPTYHPQMSEGHEPVHNYTKRTSDGSNYGKTRTGISGGGSTTRYPRDVLSFKWDKQTSRLAPTQKPVAACEYFIRTYTDPGDTVLDSCFGSGSAAVACVNTGRRFIGMELNEEYFQIGVERVQKHILTCSQNSQMRP